MPKCISIIHGLLTCVVLYCLQTKLDCIVVKNDEEGKDLAFFLYFGGSYVIEEMNYKTFCGCLLASVVPFYSCLITWSILNNVHLAAEWVSS